MQPAVKTDYICIDDYLAGEEVSEIKHEYVGGVVYAMAGGTKDHNQIALNIYSSLRQALRGGACRVFVSDVKVRLKALNDELFYYPDVVVGCDSRDTHRLYLCYPKLIVEVSSDSTERLDRREKRWAYQTIETLEEYLLVSQDRFEATVFRRRKNWDAEVFRNLNESVDLNSISLSLPLSGIYEGVIQNR